MSSLWCIDWVGGHYANQSIYVFCIKKCIGTQGGVCRQLKIFFNRSVVYATDRSKPPVQVLFLFCVAFFFYLYYWTLHILKSSNALCPRVSSFLLTLWSPRLGKRELVCVLLVHLFVCFVRASLCHFSLHFGVRGWVRFVIVALHGIFYQLLATM